jgi:hypothetical protein
MRRPALALIGLLALVGFAHADQPGDWSVFAVREEIAPRSWTEPDGQGGMRLGLAGRGDDAVDGRWVREIPVTAGAPFAATTCMVTLPPAVASTLFVCGAVPARWSGRGSTDGNE